jgi:serine/threonine-protein kinase HipA
MATRAPVPKALWVHGPDGLVGTLHNTDPLSFSYSAAWLATPGATPIHPDLPLATGPSNAPYVAAFFENLLPEGDQRTVISMREQVSSVFGLLARVGGESAGAYTLVPEGEMPQAPVYQPLTWEQVRVLVHDDGAQSKERDAIERAAQDLPRPRMSMSGAQFKVLLYLDEGGNPARPMGNAPSTHILKPDIQRPDIKAFASSVNESIVMRAAASCGLPTAGVSYQAVAQACLVERYDRVRQGDGSLRRLWQADFCQLLGVQSGVKYEHEGGPGFKECYDKLALSAQPAVDRRHLLRWLFFNLCAGNNDSHAKNLSLLATPQGLRLAPFYDMMCTRIYPGLSNQFAFEIAGESEPGKLADTHLAELAKTLGVGVRYLQKLAIEVAQQVALAVPQAAAELMPSLDFNHAVMAERLAQRIKSTATKMGRRFAGADADADASADMALPEADALPDQ